MLETFLSTLHFSSTNEFFFLQSKRCKLQHLYFIIQKESEKTFTISMHKQHKIPMTTDHLVVQLLHYTHQ